MMMMPFGKYKGWPVNSIPQGYLVWLLNECDLRPELRFAVAAALHQQQHRHPHDHSSTASLTTEAVGRWYRRMAMEFHPDHRGSNEAMKTVNRGREVLLELVGA